MAPASLLNVKWTGVSVAELSALSAMAKSVRGNVRPQLLCSRVTFKWMRSPFTRADHAPRICAEATTGTASTSRDTTSRERRMAASNECALFGSILRKLANEIGVDAAHSQPDQLLRCQVRVTGVGQRLHEFRVD